MEIKANPALQFVKEVKEVGVNEAAELLKTGEWIAIAAASKGESVVFSIGRVTLTP